MRSDHRVPVADRDGGRGSSGNWIAGEDRRGAFGIRGSDQYSDAFTLDGNGATLDLVDDGALDALTAQMSERHLRLAAVGKRGDDDGLGVGLLSGVHGHAAIIRRAVDRATFDRVTVDPRQPMLVPGLEEVVDLSLVDDAEVENRLVSGDVTAESAADVQIVGSLFRGVRLTGVSLPGATIRDCRLTGCEMSGAMFDDARLTRVEFVDCRLSGAVLSHARLKDVSFVDCRSDGLLVRMSTLERSAFTRCDLTSGEFYDSGFDRVSFSDGDLTDADFSKARLDQVRFHGSTLTGLRGGISLRGAVIDTGQITAMGLVALQALGIVIEDDRASPLRGR